MQPLLTLTIDGQTVSVPPGTTVLQAARSIGIEIPTLCYHAKMSLLGACRLCLVEIERMKAPQTACTTTVRPDMVVRTNTPDIIKARAGMLEFLLTNHPLDCPVCDAGGHCELQDAVFAHGPGVSRYVEDKREKSKELPLGPAVIMDEERCILCRRCVRFLEEWADEVQLGYFDRNRLTYVGTFPGQPLQGTFTGNVTQVCPVGALTSRVSRFEARPWELTELPSICGLCGVGCNLTTQVKSDVLRAVAGRENREVNDEWLCDKGRFAFAHAHGTDRLRTPMIRKDGQLQPAGWTEALELVASKLLSVLKENGPDAICALGSGAATNEANYLLQRLMRTAIGTNNVDAIGRLPDGAAPLDMKRLTQADLVLLVGVDLAEEAPIVELMLRHQATLRPLKVVQVAARRSALSKKHGFWISTKPGDEALVLNGLTHLLMRTERGKKAGAGKEMEDWASAYGPKQIEAATGVTLGALKSASEILDAAQNPVVLYGTGVFGQPALHAALTNIALLLSAVPACVAPEANSRGALDMGVTPSLLPGGQPLDDSRARDRFNKTWKGRLPAQSGLTALAMRDGLAQGRVKVAYIMRSDPAGQAPGWAAALEAGAFVVVQDLFLTETARRADVVLPSVSYAEDEGTMTSLSGRVQRVRQAVPWQGQARPDWAVLSELARAMKVELGFATAETVMREIARLAPPYAEHAWDQLGEIGKPARYADLPRRFARVEAEASPAAEQPGLALATGRLLFDGSTLLLQTPAFQEICPQPFLELNPRDAEALGVHDGQPATVKSARGSLIATTRFNDDLCPGCVYLPLQVRDVLVGPLMGDGPVTWVTVAPAKWKR